MLYSSIVVQGLGWMGGGSGRSPLLDESWAVCVVGIGIWWACQYRVERRTPIVT